MKKYFFAILIVTLVLTASAVAQSVVITPKETVYKRPKPMGDHKKTFTVTRPIVKASTPALSKKIQDAISFEKVSEINIKEELTEIQWLEEADFKVNYNTKGLLDISLFVQGTGAYPSGFTRTVVIDLKNGNRVTPAMVFTDLDGLAAKVKELQKKEIETGIADIKKDDPETENPAQLFESADFKTENLADFTIEEEGITFTYDYGFPHVIQALQPEGRFFFKWADLKSHIKPAGLFGQFVR